MCVHAQKCVNAWMSRCTRTGGRKQKKEVTHTGVYLKVGSYAFLEGGDAVTDRGTSAARWRWRKPPRGERWAAQAPLKTTTAAADTQTALLHKGERKIPDISRITGDDLLSYCTLLCHAVVHPPPALYLLMYFSCDSNKLATPVAGLKRAVPLLLFSTCVPAAALVKCPKSPTHLI